MRVIWRQRALEQLLDIIDFIAADNVDAALVRHARQRPPMAG
jgi:plasmid stabilization system protein ParE